MRQQSLCLCCKAVETAIIYISRFPLRFQTSIISCHRMAFLLSYINVGFFEVMPLIGLLFSYHMEGAPRHMEAISTVLKTSERIDQTFPVGSTSPHWGFVYLSPEFEPVHCAFTSSNSVTSEHNLFIFSLLVVYKLTPGGGDTFYRYDTSHHVNGSAVWSVMCHAFFFGSEIWPLMSPSDFWRGKHHSPFFQ